MGAMLAESVTGAALGGNRGGVDTVAICKEEVVAAISGRCIGAEDVVVRDDEADGADGANGMSLEPSSSGCCCCCSRLRFFFLRMYHAIAPTNIMNATTTGITMVSVRFPLNDDWLSPMLLLLLLESLSLSLSRSESLAALPMTLVAGWSQTEKSWHKKEIASLLSSKNMEKKGTRKKKRSQSLL